MPLIPTLRLLQNKISSHCGTVRVREDTSATDCHYLVYTKPRGGKMEATGEARKEGSHGSQADIQADIHLEIEPPSPGSSLLLSCGLKIIWLPA